MELLDHTVILCPRGSAGFHEGSHALAPGPPISVLDTHPPSAHLAHLKPLTSSRVFHCIRAPIHVTGSLLVRIGVVGFFIKQVEAARARLSFVLGPEIFQYRSLQVGAWEAEGSWAP